MSNAVTYFGKWRIKPSAKLPIFLRFMNNACFMPQYMNTAGIKNSLRNRTYVNHMMYFSAKVYNRFEKEIIDHLKKNDGWFEKYCKIEIDACKKLYKKGLMLKKTDWSKKTSKNIAEIILQLIEEERIVGGPWYAQYPMDEYFEDAIERKLRKYISDDDSNFRKLVLIFSNSEKTTEVSEERWLLLKIAKRFNQNKENLARLSSSAKNIINKHLEKFAYINRGLATSRAYTFEDIVKRLKEIRGQIKDGKKLDEMIYNASKIKAIADYKWALKKIKPKVDFKRIIVQARKHSYLRNLRVESFFNVEYGASFAYNEVARRANFNPDLIMEVTIPEMIDFLRKNKPLPGKKEMEKRVQNYAMVVKNGATSLITDGEKIKKIAKIYEMHLEKVEIIHGRVACLGGVIKGRAKICLDKSEIGKVKSGDILVANFTTPDFIPAMEKAAAIVADQGGLSSHAAIVSRELGVPCVMATKNGTRVIRENDLIEVNAKTGVVKILERAK